MIKQTSLFTYLIAILILGAGLPAQAMEPIESRGERLIKAAKRGDVNTIKTVLNDGANINYQDWLGFTALIEATYQGQLAAAEFLIECGADVHKKSNEGNTALMWAVRHDSLRPLAQHLIELGVNVNDKNKSGKTALMLAAQAGCYLGCELLLQYGADSTITKNDKNAHAKALRSAQWVSDNSFSQVISLLSDPANIAQVISRRENNPALEQGFKEIIAKHHAENENVCQALLNREMGIQ